MSDHQDQPDMELRGTKVEKGWRDRDGFVGPIQPGLGPRSDPKGAFPTGPAVDSSLPNIICRTVDNQPFNLHEKQQNRPAVVVFYRSAVW